MDAEFAAVEKAAEALFERHTNSDLAHGDTRDRVVRAVLEAVGYDALVAERDRYRSALGIDVARSARAALDAKEGT